MNLEVGMYVRTKNGEIGKLEELYCQDSYEHSVRMKIDGYYDSYLLKEIDFEKASNNIIDLIEVGDYVNGGQVREKKEDYIRISGGNFMFQYLKENEIETIVTKEQFENIKYSLEG